MAAMHSTPPSLICVARKFIVFLFTIILLIGCGEAEADIVPTPTYTPEQQLGSTVFSKECGACHSLAPETVIVGPSMHGIANRAGSRVAGEDATRYLLTSILKPDAYLVDGFENLMPSTLSKKLTGEEMDAVVAFLLTLE